MLKLKIFGPYHALLSVVDSFDIAEDRSAGVIVVHLKADPPIVETKTPDLSSGQVLDDIQGFEKSKTASP